MNALTTHCIFEYMYRDAGNFKTDGRLLLIGQVGETEAVLLRCLDWGNQFVAEQVGVPSLCREHWEAVGEGPSDLDHAFHEFKNRGQSALYPISAFLGRPILAGPARRASCFSMARRNRSFPSAYWLCRLIRMASVSEALMGCITQSR